MNEKIMICDDEELYGEMIAGFLECLGLNSEVITDSRTAKEKVNKAAYSLIITDYCMPHINGVELIDIIKKSEYSSEAKIILCSSMEVENIDETALIQTEFIPKPLEFWKFKSVVCAAMVKGNQQSVI